MNAAGLVGFMRTAFEEVEAVVADVGPERMERPGACGEWSMKNILAHFAENRSHFTELRSAFTGEPPVYDGMPPDFPPESSQPGTPRPPGYGNRRIYEASEARKAEVVLDDFRAVMAGTIAWLETLDDSDAVALVGFDTSAPRPTTRYAGIRSLRKLSEVPDVLYPTPLWRWYVWSASHMLAHTWETRMWLWHKGGGANNPYRIPEGL